MIRSRNDSGAVFVSSKLERKSFTNFCSSNQPSSLFDQAPKGKNSKPHLQESNFASEQTGIRKCVFGRREGGSAKEPREILAQTSGGFAHTHQDTEPGMGVAAPSEKDPPF